MLTDKFDECRLCANEGTPHICNHCESGELFDPVGEEPLDFSDDHNPMGVIDLADLLEEAA